MLGLACDRQPAYSLYDSDPGDRHRALHRFDRDDAQERFNELQSIWENDSDPTVRSSALALLALTRDARAMGPLSKALRSGSSLFEETAIYGLANLGSLESCKELASAYVAWPERESETLARMAKALRIYNPACHAVVEGYRASHPKRVTAVVGETWAL
jgi:HEAT repeat protein